MDRLKRYRQIIMDALSKYADLIQQGPEDSQDVAVVFDEEHDHYLLTVMGWQGRRRVKGNVVHIRLFNDKVWIEEDGLEQGITDDLLAAGIPNEDIVLAFHHPNVRPMTEFAVA